MKRRHEIHLSILIALAITACAPAADPPGEEPASEPQAAIEIEDVASSGCESNDDCGDGEYCAFLVGECGGVGTCEVRPEICTMDYTPVCGCDGETYSNACNAASNGVSVAADGECA